jgi:hypothetical protein
MLRTTLLLVSGAFLMGCESNGVQGQYAYRDSVDGTPSYGHGSVQGDTRYHAPVQGDTTAFKGDRDYTRDRDYLADGARPAAARVNPNTNAEPGDAARAGHADPERAAYADTARFPTDMKPIDDHRLTAIVDKSAGTIKLANSSNEPMRDVKVWVNGSYVTQVNDLPANGTVTLNRHDFSNRDGRMVTDMNDVSTIQVQSKDHLYNAQGPVFDKR